MDKLMQKAMEKHKIVRYQQTFIDVMTTYKSLLEAENEQLHKPVVGGPASASALEGEQLPAEALAQNGRDGVMKWCDSCGKITKWIDGDCENYKTRGGSAKGVLPR